MKVKIDTKEKFHILFLQESILSANMTEELSKELLLFLHKDIKNVVLNIEWVNEIEEPVALKLANIQQNFYDNGASFVICGIKANVEEYLDKLELLEVINATPTESEAGDIVQLEEIEREMME